MKALEAAALAARRFHRDAFLGYYGNGWRSNPRMWRQIVRMTQRGVNEGLLNTEEVLKGSNPRPLHSTPLGSPATCHNRRGCHLLEGTYA